MTLIIIEQCQCAYCCASRALDVLRGLPYMPDDGRAALDAIEAALDELEEKGFARWDAMNDVATAAGLNWMDATQQDIVGAIEQTRARVAELEAQLAAQQWRPVTEPPEKAGDYAVMVDGWPDSIAAHYGPVLKGSSEGWEWVWVDFDGEIIPVVCWQSLPAAIHPAVG